MLTFIATGDWHIGARMGTAGAAAPRFREARFLAAERVVALAAEEGAGAIFLLGDTFDGDGVGMDDLRRTRDILAAAPCEVLVLPGNHDCWHTGGALRSFAGLAADTAQVSVVTTTETPLVVSALPGITFYPCPVLRHAEVGDPTAWMPPRREADGVRIGLIHAALDQADWGGRVPERVAEVRDLDLALLGDWHKPVDGPDGRTFYPGALEPGGFGEAHTGQIILATVTPKGAEARRIEVGRLAWRRLELAFESAEIGGVGPEALKGRLTSINSSPPDTALRLHLSGKLTHPEMDRLDEILAALAEQEWATCDLQSEVALLGAPDLDSFEEPAIRAVAKRIWAGDQDPALRRRALAILAEKVEATR